MAAAGSHRESVAGAIGFLGSLGGNGHGPFKDEQAGVEFVGVLGVERIGLHVPIDDFGITLLTQFGLENASDPFASPDLGWLNLACRRLRTDRLSREG